MAQVLEYDARSAIARKMLQRLIDSKKFKIGDISKKIFIGKKMNGLEEAIEDIKVGRVTTYENYEEYEKATNKMLGYV